MTVIRKNEAVLTVTGRAASKVNHHTFPDSFKEAHNIKTFVTVHSLTA